MTGTPGLRPAWVAWKPVTAALAVTVAVFVVVRWTSTARPSSVSAADIGAVALNGFKLAGDSAARIVVLEFSDFQCPVCLRFAREVQPTLLDRYVNSGRILWAFRQLPLNLAHREPHPGVLAECAAAQGRFWEMHQILVREPVLRSEGDAVHLAASSGVNEARFRDCIGSSAVQSRLAGHAASAAELGIDATPTFLFGLQQTPGLVTIRRVAPGFMSAPVFTEVLDFLIATEMR